MSPNTALPKLAPWDPETGTTAAMSCPGPEQETCVQATTSSTTTTTTLDHPDSTHQPYTAPFTEGEDILVHDPDGLIYFGIVVEVDHDSGQCLVRFGDCSEKWANFFELRRLDEDPAVEEDIPAPSSAGKVTTLEQFHQELSKDLIDPWQEITEDIESEIKLPEHVIKARSQLSYDLDGLIWDEAHQVNQTETYCYCGERGDWFKRMLQCVDCLQWFHQECIRSLSYQLMCGDRFFKFICTLCNGKDEETIQRLELGVVDALHLVILNLILSKNQKFHDLETSIIPLIKKKLKYLTDGGSNAHVRLSMIQPEHIVKILSNNKSRFKCGSETGKQSSFWGLRRMVAPWLPSKYLMYRPQYCKVSSSIKRLKETLIQPNNKKGIFHHKNKPEVSVTAISRKSSLKRGRPRDISDFSDSETSSFGTLDLLIKPPKDFSGRNNPFSLSSDKAPPTPATPSVSTPGSCETDSSLSTPYLADKESPLSSRTPTRHAGEECRKELLQSVADRLKETTDSDGGGGDTDTDQDSVFKIPSVITSYFAPTAKTRIAGGNAFQVKARRLTLNGDIAYLINWEPNTMFDS